MRVAPLLVSLALLAPLLGSGCTPDVQIKAQIGPLVASPGLVDMGVLPVGETTTATVDLETTRGTVTVVAVDVLNVQGSWFSVDTTGGLVVTTDSPAQLTVTYAPGAPGYQWAEIRIQTDEDSDNQHIVQARGEGSELAARAWPALLDLGPVADGASAQGTFTVANEGGVPFDLEGASLSDPAFSLVTAVPATVDGGDRLSVTVSFASDGAEHIGSVALDLGPTLSLPPLAVQANACSAPDGALYDADGDGASVCSADCDDADPATHPGAAETCDAHDNDCDGVVDEGTSCGDDDGDGASEADGDCNDGDPSMHPGATEDYTNGKDDDCDGTTDDGNGDLDHDGVTGWAGDCLETDPTVYPGAPELPDGLDNDCDGRTDEDTLAGDDDGDGLDEADGDCDDADAAIQPSATEVANGRDDDCDGTVDEGTTAYDDDGDGFTEAGGDCDDADAAVNPARTESAGNGIDDNCDGVSA